MDSRQEINHPHGSQPLHLAGRPIEKADFVIYNEKKVEDHKFFWIEM